MAGGGVQPPGRLVLPAGMLPASGAVFLAPVAICHQFGVPKRCLGFGRRPRGGGGQGAEPSGGGRAGGVSGQWVRRWVEIPALRIESP